MTDPAASPQWNRDTKLLVTVIALLILLVLAYLARNVIPLMVLAAVLAYIFQPAVGWLQRHRVPRGLGAALCLLLLILLVALGPVLLTPALVDGVRAIIDVLVRLPALFQQWAADVANDRPVLNFAGLTIELAAAVKEAEVSVADAFGQFQLPNLSDMVTYLLTGVRTAGGILQTAVGIASGLASAALSGLLLLVLTFFLTKDGRQLGAWLHDLVLPPYQPEIGELGRRLDVVWKSFFRGQILLSMVVGFVVFMATSLLGLPGAFVLGLLAGLLEVIPNLGPVLAMIPAVLVALVQGSNFLPISNWVFALIVVLVYFLIQQIENNVLVPRILGHSLNLHPVLVLVGVVVGASFAGILGAFLAAPVLASLKVLGLYAHAKIVGLDPLAQPAVVDVVEAGSETPGPWWRRSLARRTSSGSPTPTDSVPAGDDPIEVVTPVAGEGREEVV